MSHSHHNVRCWAETTVINLADVLRSFIIALFTCLILLSRVFVCCMRSHEPSLPTNIFSLLHSHLSVHTFPYTFYLALFKDILKLHTPLGNSRDYVCMCVFSNKWLKAKDGKTFKAHFTVRYPVLLNRQELTLWDFFWRILSNSVFLMSGCFNTMILTFFYQISPLICYNY